MARSADEELDAERLVAYFNDCRRAFDALRDSPELAEKLLRMLHGYALQDWVRVEVERVKVFDPDE